MQRLVLPALAAFRPELIVVACGFDACGKDPLGKMLLNSSAFATNDHAAQGLGRAAL